MKAYNLVDIYFQLKTTDEDGLILYNGGKGDDFIAVELIKGHIHYHLNMGWVSVDNISHYGPCQLSRCDPYNDNI